MDKRIAKKAAAEWSRTLCQASIPHLVIGSVAMLLHGCKPFRKTFKDIDFLLPEDRKNEMKSLLERYGFSRVNHGNYETGGVTIGIATPESHPGLPNPAEEAAGIEIDGVRTLTLAGLIAAKKVAVENKMNQIAEKRYRSQRKKSVVKQLNDLCALWRTRDAQ